MTAPMARRKRKNELNVEVRAMLELGADMLGFFAGLNEDQVNEELEALWQLHRDEVLADFVSRRPGERPEMWWRVDSPEPRPPLRPADGSSEAWAEARKQRRIEEIALLIRHNLLSHEEQAGLRTQEAQATALEED